jgi:hypothetical protein
MLRVLPGRREDHANLPQRILDGLGLLQDLRRPVDRCQLLQPFDVLCPELLVGAGWGGLGVFHREDRN